MSKKDEIESIKIGSICLKPVHLENDVDPQHPVLRKDTDLDGELKEILVRNKCNNDREQILRLFAIIQNSKLISFKGGGLKAKSFVLVLNLNITDPPDWNIFFSLYSFTNTFKEFETLDLPTVPEYVVQIYSILKLIFRKFEEFEALDVLSNSNSNSSSFDSSQKIVSNQEKKDSIFEASDEFPFDPKYVDVSRLDCIVVHLTYGVVMKTADIIFVYKEFTPTFKPETLKNYWRYPIR